MCLTDVTESSGEPVQTANDLRVSLFEFEIMSLDRNGEAPAQL